MTWPGKIKLLANHCFRVSKPAIFGIEVVDGKIKKGYKLMNKSGNVVGEIREMQRDKDKVDEATSGMQLALSCDGIFYGKDVTEGEELYTYISKAEIGRFDKQPSILNDEEKVLLDEIRKIVVGNPFE
jgi:translation initiation factor 5B